MPTWLARLLVAIGLWLARRGGWSPPVCPRQHVAEVAGDVMAVAREVTLQVQQKFGDASGEFRRREALRVLLNYFPKTPTRELCLAIELSLP